MKHLIRVSDLNIRDIQTLLKSLINSPDASDSSLFYMIDNAKETLLDMIMEGAKKEDILDALLELLIIATILNIDVEGELNKYFSSSIYKVMS